MAKVSHASEAQGRAFRPVRRCRPAGASDRHAGPWALRYISPINCDGYCTDGASRRAFEESLNQIFTLEQLDAEGVWPLRMLHAWEQEECRTAQDILLALLGAGFAHRYTDCAEDAHCGTCMAAAA